MKELNGWWKQLNEIQLLEFQGVKIRLGLYFYPYIIFIFSIYTKKCWFPLNTQVNLIFF